MTEPQDDDELPTHNGPFQLRGYPVMLASDVAQVLGVETREIVQNIKNNNEGEQPLFPERYAFQITEAEQELLRSSGLIPKAGRGGSRSLPWVVTRRGSIRLTTLMRSPQAIRAADIFVDVFDEVMVQVLAGKGQLTLSQPGRLLPQNPDDSAARSFQKRIMSAIDGLLNTVVDPERKTTVGDELQETAAEAVNHIKEWLRGKKVANEKIEAETLLIIEQAHDMYERRQADLADRAIDRERKTLENLRLKIEIVQDLYKMHGQLEPSAVIGMVGSFSTSPQLLPKPSARLLQGAPRRKKRTGDKNGA